MKVAPERLIGYRMPFQLMMFLGVGFFCLLPTVPVAIFKTQQYDVMAITIIIALVGVYIYASSRGYRVGWNQEYIFIREAGFDGLSFGGKPFKRIKIENILDLTPTFGSTSVGMARFVPFELIEIVSRNSLDAKISIDHSSLEKGDLEKMWTHVLRQRADLAEKYAELLGVSSEFP